MELKPLARARERGWGEGILTPIFEWPSCHSAAAGLLYGAGLNNFDYVLLNNLANTPK